MESFNAERLTPEHSRVVVYPPLAGVAPTAAENLCVRVDKSVILLNYKVPLLFAFSHTADWRPVK